MLNEDQPGFQIDPSVDADASLAELERVMQNYIDYDFCFDAEDTRQNGSRGSMPHIDDTLARRRLGLARHLNVFGDGLVALQLVSPRLPIRILLRPTAGSALVWAAIWQRVSRRSSPKA